MEQPEEPQSLSDLVKKVVVGLMVLGVLIAIIYFGFFSDYRSLTVEEWRDYNTHMSDIKARLKILGNEIEITRGTSDCKSDQECRVIGLGTKVCGKFTDFLIYSTSVSDESKLLELAREFNRIHEGLMDQSFLVRKCGVKPAYIRCVSGTCKP